MADYRAIMAVCEAVLELLRTNATGFNNELEFEPYTTKDFSERPLKTGVYLFLYRIIPNKSHRTPSGRIGTGGLRQYSQLPLDLHFLLIASGTDASMQHMIAGWMMRTLEDNPIIPAALLNALTPGIFRPEETVEIILSDLDTEVMVHIWDTLPDNSFKLSVPYLARNVLIESDRDILPTRRVQDRTFQYWEIEHKPAVP